MCNLSAPEPLYWNAEMRLLVSISKGLFPLHIESSSIPLEQSMPWNPGKQWQTPELHSPFPWQLRGHSWTESVKTTKWGRERRGTRRKGRGHQSIWLNHWQHTFFKILHIKSRCWEWCSRTDIKSVISLFQDSIPVHFSSWAEKVLWISHSEALYYPSITSLHNVLEHKHVQKIQQPHFQTFLKLWYLLPRSVLSGVINAPLRCVLMVKTHF